jgi:hypothetical protein
LVKKFGGEKEACAALWKEIQDLVDELKDRFERQNKDWMGPGETSTTYPEGDKRRTWRWPKPNAEFDPRFPNGSNGYYRHLAQTVEKQTALDRKLDFFEKNCGGQTPDTKEARKQAKEVLPKAEDYDGAGPKLTSAGKAVLETILFYAIASIEVTGGADAPVAAPIALAAAIMLGLGLFGGGGKPSGA